MTVTQWPDESRKWPRRPTPFRASAARQGSPPGDCGLPYFLPTSPQQSACVRELRRGVWCSYCSVGRPDARPGTARRAGISSTARATSRQRPAPPRLRPGGAVPSRSVRVDGGGTVLAPYGSGGRRPGPRPGTPPPRGQTVLRAQRRCRRSADGRPRKPRRDAAPPPAGRPPTTEGGTRKQLTTLFLCTRLMRAGFRAPRQGR